MEGWIKIHRKITEHWLWTNPIAMWRWLDLLLQAKWEDTKIYKDNKFIILSKGELIASADYLTDRWSCSKSTTKAFLDTLESEKMIIRRVEYPRTAIITICNFDKYQLLDQEVSTPNSTPNSTLNDTPNSTLVLPAKTSKASCKNMTNPIGRCFINDNDDNCIDSDDNHIDRTMINDSDLDVSLGYASSTPNSTPNSTQEKNIKNIYNLSLSKACACTCEEDYMQQLLADVAWVEMLAMNMHIAPTAVGGYLQSFGSECQCKGTVHNGLKDYRSHFYDWLRIAISYERKEKTNGNTNRATAEEERHSAVISRAAELFASGK